MYLSNIRIENFLGIRFGEIDFRETTVLIGENDSGKSAILEAICKVLAIPEAGILDFSPLEFHQVKEGDSFKPAGSILLALTFRERQPDEWSFMAGNEMGITFNDNASVAQSLTIEVTADPGTGNSHGNWRIHIPAVNTSHLDNDPSVLDWIRRMNPVFRIRGGIMTSIPEINTDESLEEGEPGPENFASRIKKHFDSLLSGTSPDIHREIDAGYRIAKEYLEKATGLFQPEGAAGQDMIREILGKRAGRHNERGRNIPFRHGSAAEMIGLLLFTNSLVQSGSQLADPSAEPVFIIEDPEANLHPMTLESVRMLINRLKWQKIITTQSGDFLSTYPMQDIVRITRRGGKVSQWTIAPGSLSGEELRRLSYHIRMRRGAATFARCWLLVEGESEIWLLPHLARLCGYDLNMEGVICVEFAQCGIAPLIKAARQLGIEWYLLADGDAAGKSYAQTARHFIAQAGEDFSSRVTRLRERDIEHHLFFNGYAPIYIEYGGFQGYQGREPHPGKIIGRAIHRQSKPFMAIAVVEAMAREGSPGVPAQLRKTIESCIYWSQRQS